MNRFLVGTVGVACALLASTAIAGWTQAYPVVVDQQAMAAYGSLGSTRSSGGAFDELGCRVWAFPGAPLQGMCFASDEKGNSVSCMLATDGAGQSLVRRRAARAEVQYIVLYMKRILIELDDRCARDLERVAPAKARQRAEFVRLAIRRAIDLALDVRTGDAYRARPLAADGTPEDLVGWDQANQLATPSSSKASPRKKPRRATRAA